MPTMQNRLFDGLAISLSLVAIALNLSVLLQPKGRAELRQEAPAVERPRQVVRV